MIQNVLAVALGGALGALARFGAYELLAPAVPHRSGSHSPGATILVNLIGCAALGLVLGYVDARGPLDERVRAFLTIGVLGALTTFSSYAGDALRLFQEGRPASALGYLFGSMAGGLALCAVGFALARALAQGPGTP